MRGNALDICLSKGYFRMQQDIFTCQYVRFDDKLCSVHWLRIVLADIVYGKKQQRLLSINSKFSVEVKPFILSKEIEALYAVYRDFIDFDAPDSVASCLLDDTPYNSFDTYVVEVRDNTKLIAAGIFDNGSQSIAGIMNFYDPAYRKQSLGKFLMLQKIDYARQQQKAYYYPGYLVRNYPKFDYKLFACEAATEVFDALSGRWYPFSWKTLAILAGDGIDES
ncbi:arginine-tRNA-protein transferase [Spirosoma sp. KNUC1025]|uniref:arginine-tRNA-protein transferase n=1 Tax=Spirosoma sp. KNUC1025 TaxID=2894082 RepID=UPI0038680025|nr:arginine-tRNA-protein transferase [Spirosoma sp. KNUC1025]